MSKLKFSNIDDYHECFPVTIRKKLDILRLCIKQAAPDATETINYGMPAFRINKVLVCYAVYKEHIGFYPTPNPISYFKKELNKFVTSKGAIQFPIDKSLPVSLIKKIVKFRVKEDRQLIKKSPSQRKSKIVKETADYSRSFNAGDRKICNILAEVISNTLPEAENKIWHAHPVWFIDGNPIVGYSKLKDCIRLLFWSGQSFEEKDLKPEGKFKAAEIRYTDAVQIDRKILKRCLNKSKKIQWDYKNIVKRRGKLERIS